jgi:hypothetical protein
LVLVIVGERFGCDHPVDVTDGRIIIVTVGEDVAVSVIMIRIVIVGVDEADGRNAEGGSSSSTLEFGVGVPKPGRKGVFDGGKKALRSLAEPCFQAAGIDPVISEQPNISVAAAGQNNF